MAIEDQAVHDILTLHDRVDETLKGTDLVIDSCEDSLILKRQAQEIRRALEQIETKVYRLERDIEQARTMEGKQHGNQS